MILLTIKRLLLTLTFTLKSTTEEDKKNLYNKRDDFTFPIVSFPFISSNILSSPAHSCACVQYVDFQDRAQLFTQKLRKQGYVISKLK